MRWYTYLHMYTCVFIYTYPSIHLTICLLVYRVSVCGCESQNYNVPKLSIPPLMYLGFLRIDTILLCFSRKDTFLLFVLG